MFADLNKLIGVLKVVTSCGVTIDSKLTLTILHLVKFQVNSLSLHHIYYLQHLLSKVEAGNRSLLVALKRALPIVFESQLDSQLETDNAASMARAFHFAATNRLPPAVQKRIGDSLMKFRGDWTPRDAASVIRSLCQIGRIEQADLTSLLFLAMNRLTAAVSGCDVKDLLAVMNLCAQQYSWQQPFWFNASLCKAIGWRAINENWPFDSCEIVDRAFGRYGYVHSDFLQYFASVIVETEADRFPFHLLRSFATTGCQLDNRNALLSKVVDWSLKVSSKRQRL